MYDTEYGATADGAVLFGVSMSEQKLESFKIGDKHKPRVASGATKEAKEAKEKSAEEPVETATLGFARIEGILDNEPAGAVAENLHRMLTVLTEREQEAKTAKDKAVFKRARAAVERTQELLAYLFQTKAAMLAAVEQNQTNQQNQK